MLNGRYESLYEVPDYELVNTCLAIQGFIINYGYLGRIFQRRCYLADKKAFAEYKAEIERRGLKI